MAQLTTLTIKAVTNLTRAVDFGSSKHTVTVGTEQTILNGTSAGQSDLAYCDEALTIAASSNTDIDLAGSLADPLGAAVVFARIDAIIIKAAAGNTNNVVVGAAASNGFVGPFGASTHTIAVRPGGILALYAGSSTGWTVTAGTGDLLRIANSGAGSSVACDVLIIGRSA